MLKAEFDSVPKKVMHSVFHFMSANLVLSTIVLLLAGLNVTFEKDPLSLVLFIAVYFVPYDVVSLIIAFTSGIKKAPLIPLWNVFALIAIFAVLGAV